MNGDYSNESLNFSGMSDDELLEIVNSNPGRYRQGVVEGARDELKGRAEGTRYEQKGRGDDDAQAEINYQVTTGEAQATTDESQPPVLPAYVPGGKLFSAGQVAVATSLGTPIAGGILLAQNHRAIGEGRSAWRPLLIGIVVTGLLIAIGFLLPKDFPNRGFAPGVCFGMYYFAKQWRGGAINRHLKAGGRKGSWWAAVGVGVACSVILVVLFFTVVVAFNIDPRPDEQSASGAYRPVAKVRVSQAGDIEMNGVRLNPEEFRSALEKLRDRGGAVWYYRERMNEPPSEAALKAFKSVVDAGLPIRMSSKPDFSDYIDESGRSVPVR
jgi:hypothetical protein